MKVILNIFLRAETEDKFQMQISMINGGCVYKKNELFRFFNTMNTSVFFTVKRGTTLHFSFVATNYIFSQEQ